MPSETQPPSIPRPIFGLGLGAFFGGILAGWPGAGIGAGAGLLLARTPRETRRGAVTTQRQATYERAMRSATPEQLEALAVAYAAEGLNAHAIMLRRRAAQRRLTPEAAAERRSNFVRGLASSKADAVERLAATFRAEGSRLASQELAQHATDLRAATAGRSDEALVQRFEQRLALVVEVFGADSPQATSAAKNLDAARAALAPKETGT